VERLEYPLPLLGFDDMGEGSLASGRALVGGPFHAECRIRQSRIGQNPESGTGHSLGEH